MNVTEVTDNIFRLSANMEGILFEGLWPIPNGVAMNSYIVKGSEKTAIVDGVCGWDGVPETLFNQLDKINVDINSIDYVIVNHMEPDHSGWIENFRKIRPEFTVVTSKKAVPLMKGFFEVTEDIIEVGDGDSLDLGGRQLAFVEIPNVHWPETIATYDVKTGTLMPCDAFGSFGSIGEAPYDDQLTESQLEFFEQEAVRYYSNIVSAFSQPVLKAIEKASSVPINIIAPGHGIVWRKNPMKIVNDYIRYANYQKGPCEQEVTVIWSSMYGNTEKAIQPVIDTLLAEDIKVKVHRVPQDSHGDIVASAWSSTGLVLAMPTYEYKMFPPMFDIINLLAKKKFLNREVFRLGSYGWSGGAQKSLDDIMTIHKPNWNFVEPVEFLGSPTQADIDKVKAGCIELASRVKQAIASKSA